MDGRTEGRKEGQVGTWKGWWGGGTGEGPPKDAVSQRCVGGRLGLRGGGARAQGLGGEARTWRWRGALRASGASMRGSYSPRATISPGNKAKPPLLSRTPKAATGPQSPWRHSHGPLRLPEQSDPSSRMAERPSYCSSSWQPTGSQTPATWQKGQTSLSSPRGGSLGPGEECRPRNHSASPPTYSLTLDNLSEQQTPVYWMRVASSALPPTSLIPWNAMEYGMQSHRTRQPPTAPKSYRKHCCWHSQGGLELFHGRQTIKKYFIASTLSLVLRGAWEQITDFLK